MEDVKKLLIGGGSYVFKGIIGIALTLSLFIFNEMRDSMVSIQKDVEGISDIVIRLDEKVERNKSDIDEHTRDIRELERTKADKR